MCRFANKHERFDVVEIVIPDGIGSRSHDERCGVDGNIKRPLSDHVNRSPVEGEAWSIMV